MGEGRGDYMWRHKGTSFWVDAGAGFLPDDVDCSEGEAVGGG